MKKEEKIRKKSSALFKLLTISIMATALWLVHAKYVANKMHYVIAPSKEAQVMKVLIETGENAVVNGEEKPQEGSQNALDEEISTFVSNDLKQKPSIKENMDHYRVHLAHVARLMEAFAQNEDYEHDLEFLLSRSSEYDVEICNILKEAKGYRDEYLVDKGVDKDAEYTKLPLEGGFVTGMVDKILDIKKKNPEHTIRTKRYDVLKKQMDHLVEYFYSQEFLKKYLGND